MFLVLTKIDLVAKEQLLPLIEAMTRQYNFAEVVPVSARKKDGLDILLQKIVEKLPQGERYFPQDQYTDQPQRFMVAELIRERILVETGEEVPYASAVVIERFEEPETPAEKPRKKGAPRTLPLTRIAAAIYCERAGQKAILIGKGGSKLKEIGTSARKTDRIVAGHAGVPGTARNCAARLARIEELYRVAGLAQSAGATGDDAGKHRAGRRRIDSKSVSLF